MVHPGIPEKVRSLSLSLFLLLRARKKKQEKGAQPLVPPLAGYSVLLNAAGSLQTRLSPQTVQTPFSAASPVLGCVTMGFFAPFQSAPGNSCPTPCPLLLGCFLWRNSFPVLLPWRVIDAAWPRLEIFSTRCFYVVILITVSPGSGVAHLLLWLIGKRAPIRARRGRSILQRGVFRGRTHDSHCAGPQVPGNGGG